MPLPKYCNRCDERYQPTGKAQKICAKCLRISQLKGKKEREELK